MDFNMHPIGVIHSPFTQKDQTPSQPRVQMLRVQWKFILSFLRVCKTWMAFLTSFSYMSFIIQAAIPCVSNHFWIIRSAACLQRAILLVPTPSGFQLSGSGLFGKTF